MKARIKTKMARAAKRDLFAELSEGVTALAEARQGKRTLVQDALRATQVTHLKTELRGIQGYWSRKAKAKGLLTETDLERYLRKLT